MRSLLILALSLCLASVIVARDPIPNPPVETVYGPFEAVVMANTDAKIVEVLNDPNVQPEHMRYLWLPGNTKQSRQKQKQALDFLLNSLNTKYRKIVRTASLPGLPADNPDPVVLRINLDDYGIDPKAWDRLAENGSGKVPIPDPYFHTFVENVISEEDTYDEKEVEKEGWVTDGTRKWWGTYKEKTKVKVPGKKTKKRVFASAPWLAIEPDPNLRGSTITSLITVTQTKNPILNGQWFFAYATLAPAYYDMIGIHTQAVKQDGFLVVKGGERVFQDLAGFDLQRSKESQIAAVADSKIVTLHNRILARFPTVKGYTGGYYWSSFDTDKGIDDEDYMNTLADFDNPKIAAKEIIATWLNTLQGYAVANNKGDLLNFASPDIAQHGDQMPTRLQDKQIYAGIRNCALCHSEGLISINDKVRELAQGQFALYIVDKFDPGHKLDRDLRRNLFKKISDAFDPHLEGVITHDNAIHLSAIQACNGLTPKQNRDNNENMMVEYTDGYVTLEKAAIEAGWPKDRVEAVLKKGIGLDYTLTSLLSQKAIQPNRLVWERQGYSALMNYLITQQR